MYKIEYKRRGKEKVKMELSNNHYYCIFTDTNICIGQGRSIPETVRIMKIHKELIDKMNGDMTRPNVFVISLIDIGRAHVITNVCTVDFEDENIYEEEYLRSVFMNKNFTLTYFGNDNSGHLV